MAFDYWVCVYYGEEIVCVSYLIGFNFVSCDFAEDAVRMFHFLLLLSNFLDALKNMRAAKTCATQKIPAPINMTKVAAAII